MHCLTTAGVGLLYGNRRQGSSGGGVPHPCVASAQREYQQGAANLAGALASAAQLLAGCCS